MTLHDELLAVLASADKVQADLDAANKQITDLQAALAAVTKPSLPGTRFGSCPSKGATDSGPVTKFGTGAAVRIFKSKIAPVARPVGASIVHYSYSLAAYNASKEQALKDLAAGKYDADIIATAQAYDASVVLEIVHESDLKIGKGTITWATILAAKNHFYDVAKKANPNVLIGNTVTGWLADPKSGGDLQRWGQVKADVFGIDCDGVNPTALPYPNYDDEIASALAFVKKYAANGYRFFSVPEFCATRMPGDATSTERQKWMTALAAKFKTAGALYVCWYDYDLNVGNMLTTPTEIAAWKALV